MDGKMSIGLGLVTTLVLVAVAGGTSDFEDAREGYLFLFRNNSNLALAVNDNDCYFVAMTDLKMSSYSAASFSDAEDHILRMLNGTSPALKIPSSGNAMDGKFHDMVADVMCKGKQLYNVIVPEPTTPPPCVDTVGSVMSCSSLTNICSTPNAETLCRKYCGLCSGSLVTSASSGTPTSGSGSLPLVTSASSTTSATGDCSSNPCLHGSRCIDGVSHYTCVCVSGYTGIYCQTNIDNCSPNPCHNGGTCRDGVNSYSCVCPHGYGGSNCQIDTNDCSPNPCHNGGTCHDDVNSHTCTCPPGYTGHQCETVPGCYYKNNSYSQDQWWQDGCDYNCTCEDSARGFYRCIDLCPTYEHLPSQCSMLKHPGDCCAKPVGPECGSGCLYKGQTHQHGARWDDGCDLTCECVDGYTGKYQCTAMCLTFQLPNECHLENAPPGKCCPVPTCPAGIQIEYPAGYVPR